MTRMEEEDILEPPPYPAEWTAEQRVAAYWYALNHTGFPGFTQGWYAVWKQVEREQKKAARRLHPMTEAQP